MTESRVHLDHIINRQSTRYIDTSFTESQDFANINIQRKDNNIRYSDIISDWFKAIKKPDFQRETNAWTPKQCLEFLDSVIYERIIPSIILWRSEDNGCIYVLDGAHRLSVIRAWMTDDWGDKAGKYYDRKDIDLIKKIANETRTLINEKIGKYEDFVNSSKIKDTIVNRGGTPKNEMKPKEFNQSKFYSNIINSLVTISVQWENGNYERAEQSFLRINRQGQPLDPWEANLIEFRNGSYSRTIMSIANGGNLGHYLFNNTENKELDVTIDDFNKKSETVHHKLFVPPYILPISDLNVPLMVAPVYFQKHKYLLELIPLVINKEIALDDQKQIIFLQKDCNANTEIIINNAFEIINKLDETLEHLVSYTHNSKCLSVVPLFYWYNERGQYNRSLFYGFLLWLFAGSEEDTKNRKLIFSANRAKFEFLLQEYKSDIFQFLNLGGGAGLKSAKQTANFIQNLILSLSLNPKLDVNSLQLENIVLESINSSTKSKKKLTKSSRNVSSRDKTQVNIRELFKGSVKCNICGGIVNLKYGGIQYDHHEDYALVKETTASNLNPTHPFCNNHKQRILSLITGENNLTLPELNLNEKNETVKKEESILQLSFWGVDDFPK